MQTVTLCLGFALAPPAAAAVVLQYHNVSADTPASTSVTPEQFASHLALLDELGFRVLPLDEVLAKVRAGVDPLDRIAAITFDDGAVNILDNAAPMLEEHGWTAAVFVTTDLVGGPGMMDANALRELRSRGHLVLNHSVTHPHMVRRRPGETEREFLWRMRAEVADAQRRLADWLGYEPPPYFAWPYGEHDVAVRELLEEMGFVAFAQVSGALAAGMNWQAVPRIPVNRQYADPASLKDKLLALPLPVTDVDPASGVTSAARPRLELMLSGDWRDRGLTCFTPGGQVQPVLDVERLHTRVRLDAAVPVGRSRFTCTAPAGAGRFYWYSWLWMRRDGDRWYDES